MSNKRLNTFLKNEYNISNRNHSQDLQYTKNEPEYPTISIRNSFCYVKNFPPAITEQLKKLLTYFDEGVEKDVNALWGQVNVAIQKGFTRKAYALRAKIDILKEKIFVCWFRNNTFPTGHLNIIKDYLKEIKFHDFKFQDERELPKNFVIYRWRNMPHEPRYYQKDMIRLGRAEHRGVFESAVGTGKNLNPYLLDKRNWSQKLNCGS